MYGEVALPWASCYSIVLWFAATSCASRCAFVLFSLPCPKIPKGCYCGYNCRKHPHKEYFEGEGLNAAQVILLCDCSVLGDALWFS